MHNPIFRRTLACLIVFFSSTYETPQCAAQQEFSPSTQGAITVGVFGNYDRITWHPVSTGIMIGHIGNELHYVLTVLSPCRDKPARLWILHEGESRRGIPDSKNGQLLPPEVAREAWVVSKNPETGLALLVFHQKDPSGSLSFSQPGILPDDILRADAQLRFRAVYVAEDADKVVFARTDDLRVSFRPLGALLDDDAELPASALGAPVFEQSGSLAGLLNADAWQDSEVPVARPPGSCNRIAGRAFLYPLSHAMDMVAHFTAGLGGASKTIDELESRLYAVERKLEVLSVTREAELRNAFVEAVARGKVEEQKSIILALERISPGLTGPTIDIVSTEIQNPGIDEAVLRDGIVVLYRNGKETAEPVIQQVVLEKMPGYLVSPTSTRAWMAAISEIRYPWMHQAVWFLLTGNEVSENIKRHIAETYAGLRCDDEVRSFFSQRLDSLQPPLVDDLRYILADSAARSSMCVGTGDRS